MTPTTILQIFLIFLILEQVFESVLIVLNMRHARAAASLPPVIDKLFDQGTRQKSLEYTRAKGLFSLFSRFFGFLVLLSLIFSGFLPRFDDWLSGFQFSSIGHGVLFLLSVILILSIVNLPLSYYSTFVLEERFGFNKSTRALWLKDQLIALGLSALITGTLIFCLLYFMGSLAKTWWVFSALSIILFQVILAFVFPIWIAPLFNKFTELPEGELKAAIFNLTGEIGYKVTGIYSVDGSKRSKHANAYFAGMGKSKRIVLYDTLISILSVEQILAVLAHEIGHEKLNHIKKSIAFSSMLTFGTFFLLSIFYQMPEFYQAFGFAAQTDYRALLIFSLLFGPAMYFANPLFNLLSRRFEYQADRFAVEAIKNYEPLATALAGLSKESLSNLNPHPLYSFMHYSHPALVERIRAMEICK